MEAATLPIKKAINKGKMKKTLKNILCRSDPVFWPVISDDDKILLETAMAKYRVDKPKFKKPLWKDLKLIPKEERPKPPSVRKIEGLYFGITECSNAMKNNNCKVVLIESTVNPRLIIEPVIEACINKRVPVICVSNLRMLCLNNFGIRTSCLGIKSDCLPKLEETVLNIAKGFLLPEVKFETKIAEQEESCKVPIMEQVPVSCPYLYRADKKSRVFNPYKSQNSDSVSHFHGQDFIEFDKTISNNSTEQTDRKSYMKMVLKKISNNPNRPKIKVNKNTNK